LKPELQKMTPALTQLSSSPSHQEACYIAVAYRHKDSNDVTLWEAVMTEENVEVDESVQTIVSDILRLVHTWHVCSLAICQPNIP
jgi:hypothetical protein